jgi:hypothetical protein
MYSIQKIYNVSLLALIISISISSAIPNICLGVLILIFLYRLIKKEITFSINLQIVIFTILFFYVLIKQLVETRFNFEDSSILSRFSFVLILPILLQNTSKIIIALAIVIAAFIAMSVAIFNSFIYFLKNNTLPNVNGEIVNKILVIDRPYLGFFCLIAIILSFYLIKKLPRYKSLFLLTALILFAFILLIVARLSSLTCIFLGFIYLLFYSEITVIKKIILILSSLLILISILFSYKNMTNRFFTNISKERIKLYDPRVDIWDCSYRISQENEFNLILGCKSHQEVSDKLVDCYKTKSENDLPRRQWFVNTRFNTHNQFIDFYLVGGLMGLFLFILFIYKMIKGTLNNFYLFSLAISLVLFLFF